MEKLKGSATVMAKVYSVRLPSVVTAWWWRFPIAIDGGGKLPTILSILIGFVVEEPDVAGFSNWLSACCVNQVVLFWLEAYRGKQPPK